MRHLGLYSRSIIVGLLITGLCIIPFTAVSQTAQQQPAPQPKKPKTTYSQGINKANSELKWSQTYFLSFRKTKEAVYLKLAAAHCTNAVNMLKATQESFPNTTRFYYKAKNKRYTACRFFDELQETALRLNPRYHIKDIPANACDF